LQIDTDLLHVITSTGDGLFRFVDVDDLERPWTLKRGALLNFYCDKMAGDRPRKPAYEIFSIERRF